MPKSSKLSVPQFRKKTSALSKKELQEMLCDVYKVCPEASDLLNIAVGNHVYEEELLARAKGKVTGGFYTKSGRVKLSLPAARSAVSDFKKVSRIPANLLDLQIHFAECGARIAGSYYNLPASFYRDVENVFQAIITTLNDLDEQTGRELFGQFEKRLQGIVSDSRGDESGLHEYFEDMFLQIRWISEKNLVPSSGQAARADEKPQDNDLLDEPKYIDANEILPEEESDLFYELWFSLLDYVNRKKKIIDTGGDSLKDGIAPPAARDLSQALWDDTSVIDEYVSSHKAELSHEHQFILMSFKRRISGRFILERHLKKGSILISAEDNKTYQVRGIKSSWEEMFPDYTLPLMIDATLIPFHNVIIPDGLIFPYNVMLGSRIKRQFKDIYMTAKRRKQIITSL